MIKNALIAIAASLVLGGAAHTQDKTQDCEASQACMECPTAKKVGALLTSWESASKQARSATPEQRAAFSVKVAETAKSCPVGSRLTDTVGTVRDVLAFVEASCAAGAKNCPIENLKGEGFEEAKAMKAGRAMALDKLQQLAGYTAGKGGCGTGRTDASGAADCETGSECSSQTSCPIRLASRIGALKASFVEARREAKALSPEARGALMASVVQLSKESEAVALVPESVMALAEGLDALNQLHGKMAAWGQANPEVMAELPESAMRSFMMEVALIDEARGLLADVTETMQLLQPQAKATAASLSSGR